MSEVENLGSEFGSFDSEIDTCGSRCPIPLLRAKQALKELDPGQLLKVSSTDPAAKSDFEAMLSHLPHQLKSHTKVEDASGQYAQIDIFIIEKG